jgi:hypothetical protein
VGVIRQQASSGGLFCFSLTPTAGWRVPSPCVSVVAEAGRGGARGHASVPGAGGGALVAVQDVVACRASGDPPVPVRLCLLPRVAVWQLSTVHMHCTSQARARPAREEVGCLVAGSLLMQF